MTDIKFSKDINAIHDMAACIRNSRRCPGFILDIVDVIERLVTKIEKRRAQLLGKTCK
jgi:hypothetical protein